jgi:hypothetical protein
MRIIVRRVSFVAALAGALGVPPAAADIYTWLDPTGQVNVSNLPPPDDARVTKISREDPAAAERARAAREAAQRNEVSTLNARVSQLEKQLDAATQAPPPPVVYPTVAAPAPVAYPSVLAQTIVVPAAATPTYASACDAWSGCGWPGYFGYPWYYPNVVVVRDRNSHRFDSRRPVNRMPVPARTSFFDGAGSLPDPVTLIPTPVRSNSNIRWR